ncbi:MAG TPA: sulfatase-like hydrolase/transferase, partial [Chloroflexota bacterium]|nr:sulfatase-like hydrolase/transferase [Chloroflexota bacterium]
MPDDRSNVIFILTDDQGPWAAGCYGNDEIRTPNLDRLAASGVRF